MKSLNRVLARTLTSSANGRPTRYARRASIRIRWIIICVVTLLAFVCSYGFLHFMAMGDDVGCKLRLRDFWYKLVTDDAPPQFVQNVSAQLASVPSRGRSCTCGREYVVKSFDGLVLELPETADIAVRAIAWCPDPCHDGRRNVVLETRLVISLDEGTFQSLADSDYTKTLNEWVDMVKLR